MVLYSTGQNHEERYSVLSYIIVGMNIGGFESIVPDKTETEEESSVEDIEQKHTETLGKIEKALDSKEDEIT